MPLYEHVFLARQDVTSQQAEALAEQYKGVVEANGGSVGKVESDGTIRKNGSSVGKIEPDGTFRKDGSSIGQIESGGTIRKNGSSWGSASNCCGDHGSKRSVAALLVFFSDFF